MVKNSYYYWLLAENIGCIKVKKIDRVGINVAKKALSSAFFAQK